MERAESIGSLASVGTLGSVAEPQSSPREEAVATPAESSSRDAAFPPGAAQANQIERSVQLKMRCIAEQELLNTPIEHEWGGGNPALMFVQAGQAAGDPRADLVRFLAELADVPGGSLEDVRFAEAAALGPETPKKGAALPFLAALREAARLARENGEGLSAQLSRLKGLWSAFQESRRQPQVPQGGFQLDPVRMQEAMATARALMAQMNIQSQ